MTTREEDLSKRLGLLTFNNVRCSCAYAYVTVFANENGHDISTSRSNRKSTVSPASLLNNRGPGIENSIFKWFSVHASFRVLRYLVFSFAYLSFCPSGNQSVFILCLLTLESLLHN